MPGRRASRPAPAAGHLAGYRRALAGGGRRQRAAAAGQVRRYPAGRQFPHQIPDLSPALTATGDTGRASLGFKREPQYSGRPAVAVRCSPPGPACRRLAVAVVTAAARRIDRGLLMGIRSWFRSRRSSDAPDDGRSSLIKYRYEDPDLESVEQAAAEDVAAVEQDDKYFGRDSPASQDEL